MKARCREWLDRYVEAWRADDPALTAALFTADASYRADPFDDGLTGRDASSKNGSRCKCRANSRPNIGLDGHGKPRFHDRVHALFQ
jgi:hypothetical protein